LLEKDPGPGGQKLPTDTEKNKEFSCFEVLDHWMFSFEG
jgi:hypothetical protein